jgi:hypothetical protein
MQSLELIGGQLRRYQQPAIFDDAKMTVPFLFFL